MKKLSIEEKELLLKDLSARSPYGVKIHLESLEYGELIGTLDAVYPTEERVIVDNLDKAITPINVRCGGFKIEENGVKPYLRPMSSMTEEEVEEFRLDFHYDFYIGYEYSLNNQDGSYMMPMFVMRDYFDWLNAHHFDYRGLIEKGLALEAPKGMYETEKQKN